MKNYFKNKKIVVAGGSGFIGTNLLIRIKKECNNVSANYFESKKFKKVSGVKYLKLDLKKKKDCLKLCKNASIVIMCAANSSGAAVMHNSPLSHLSSNIIMNTNMLEAAYECSVERFLFISSSTVYPNVTFPVKEKDTNFKYFEKYYIVGWMKRFSEILCEIYSNKIKPPMKTTIVRPSNLYGEFDKFDPYKSKVIPSLIRKVIEAQNPLIVWGDGKDLKDFLYIKDFCEGILKIIKSKSKSKFEVFNLASGKSVTIKEILKIIINYEKAEHLKIKFDTTKPTMIPIRLMDISKLKKVYKFKPKFDIKTGIESTINWYRKKIIKNNAQ